METSAPIFSEVWSPYPWQQPCWDKLQQQHREKHLPHALLLHSPPDSGLQDFALLFARYLLCAQPAGSLPCGKCKNCVLMQAGSHPDFQEITFEVNPKTDKLREVITVEQVRRMIEKVQKSSFIGQCRVVLIHPVDDLMPQAANALLKTLEEPAGHTHFLLLSYLPARLLATIRSRCQKVDVPLPSIKEAEKWLAPFIGDGDKREKLLALSGGNPVVVKQWQEQEVSDTVLALGHELQQVREGRASPLPLAAQWCKQDTVLHIVCWWRWLALQVKSSPDVHAATPLLHFMDKLLLAKRHLESTANPSEQLLLESLLIDWQNLRP